MTIRVDSEALIHLKREANEAGRALATHISLLLKEGVIAKKVAQIETGLQALISTIPTSIPVERAAQLPDELLTSIFMAEAMLTAIVEARDTQSLYAAQELVKRKVAKLKTSKGA